MFNFFVHADFAYKGLTASRLPKRSDSAAAILGLWCLRQFRNARKTHKFIIAVKIAVLARPHCDRRRKHALSRMCPRSPDRSNSGTTFKLELRHHFGEDDKVVV